MNRSHWTALVLTIAAVAWMASGLYGGDAAGPADQQKLTDAKNRDTPVRVQTRISNANQIERNVLIQGVTAPARQVTLRAETMGSIEAIKIAEGQVVSRGNLLMQLEMRDRQSRLREAQALVKQRQLEFEASSSLQKDGLRSESQHAEANSLLESAKRQLQTIEIDIANTRIRVPFDGLIDEHHVEIGSFVQSADALALLVQLDPFLIVGQLSELQVEHINIGMPATATLINGEQFKGKIRHLAAQAQTATRTFRIEMEVPNPKKRRLFGMTAEIAIPRQTVSAHQVEPSVLTLDTTGDVSIKGVDSNGKVLQWPVDIVKADRNGFWLAGLPEQAEIIVMGQNFVRAGDKVEPVQAK
ncbi:MAG: efflux RND transporter periplasmic adaptor subunit [Pseudomonadota bacterium]